jgi:metal-responsive CopG/Arc/MetJ family transcriptional regulator
MIQPATKRLTVSLPLLLYSAVEQAARLEWSRPSQYVRRALARAVQQRDKQKDDDNA